jgi:hypothetical protein
VARVGAKISLLLTIIGFACWALSYVANPSPEKIDQSGQIIAQAAIPWWIPVIQWLLPFGILGIIGIIVLLRLVLKD